jgi:hypothetical protein
MRPDREPTDDTRNRFRLSRLGRVVCYLAVGALAGFHALLLIGRFQDQSILEPAVALQWGGTLALLGFLAYLRRQGVSLFRGRSALAFWLLVLLLHLVPGAPATLLDWQHTDLLLALPAAWIVSLALLLTALTARVGVGAPRPQRASCRRNRRRGPPALDPGVHPRLYARPPPPARIG